MRNILASLAFAFVVAVPPIPGQAPEHPAHPKGDIHSNPNEQQKPTIPPFVVNPATSQVNQNGANHPSGEDKQHSVRVTALPPKDWADWLAWFAGIVLTGIGATGVYLAISTLRAIRDQGDLMKRQADLMERQTGLMAVPYLQWLEVHKWHSVAVKSSEDGKSVEQISVHFAIENPTNNPLVIPDGYIRFQVGTETIKWSIGIGMRMTPKQCRMINIPMFLDESKSRLYLEERLAVMVNGSMDFNDVLGRNQPHPVCGVLWCGKDGARFDSNITVFTKTDTRHPQGEQKAN